MLIRVGKDYKNVSHIDSRGAVGDKGWHDELHPKSCVFKEIARAFEQCINDEAPQKVYVVSKVTKKISNRNKKS